MNRVRLAFASYLALVGALPAVAQIVSPGATVQLLDTGFRFTEGPLYDFNGGVYLTDLWPSNQQATAPSRIIRYDTAADTSMIVDANSGSANGMIFDPLGQVISCDRDRRQVSRRSAANIAVVESVLTGDYQGTRFNGPNDLVMDASGGIYFTDPDYENRRALPDALYFLSPAGALTQLRTYLSSSDRRPNGVVLSPNGRVLYVAVERGKHIMAYDVGPDGLLSGDREFARSDLTFDGAPLNPPVGPDGLTIDAAGNVYAAVQFAVFAWSPAGERLFDLPVPEDPTNVEIGGATGSTLFITAGKSLYAIELNLVPEPSAWLLAFCMCLSLAVWRPRTRSRSTPCAAPVRHT